ncbi:polysaccharide biosynthesis protein [Nocardioides sp. GY 10113]|uniref:oligosaccharide flippase family protein n=1 Tax=Nocardioides sp. GY 10113 TaxID=2569761 RepID=UPI0010A750B5|nr:oligosaccharide flippase family protein [Nocardioides sp. GY 10113]TIC79535.1 polysaccharide biosynthesis protein [Nocardioides sp. GY 10113]
MPDTLTADDDARLVSAGHPGRALAWTIANTAGSKVGTLAIGIALARILGPAEFGTYAVALIALMGVLAFNELGVSLAIVRWPDDPRLTAPTINSVALLSSALITVGVLFAAGPFAAAMGDPGSAGLVRLMSACVLINGIVATPAALLQRYFRADHRMYADQVNVWLGAVASLLLALGGLGALGLVLGRIVGAGVSGIMLLRFSPLPYRWGWNQLYLGRLLRFGLPLAATSILVFGIGFLDQITVGYQLGPTALGAYVLAFNLASWPVTMVSQPLRQVAPATLARLRDRGESMPSAFAAISRIVAAIAIPGCAVLAVTAPDVVAVVYGDQWSAAAAPLRWLAVFAAFRILFELVYDYVVVAGRTRSLLTVQVLWFVMLVPAVWTGIAVAGAAGAAASQVALAALVISPAYLIVLGRLGVPARTLLATLALPSALALFLTVGIGWLQMHGLSSWAVLALSGTAGLALMAATAWARRGDLAVWRQGSAPAATATGQHAEPQAPVPTGTLRTRPQEEPHDQPSGTRLSPRHGDRREPTQRDRDRVGDPAPRSRGADLFRTRPAPRHRAEPRPRARRRRTRTAAPQPGPSPRPAGPLDPP